MLKSNEFCHIWGEWRIQSHSRFFFIPSYSLLFSIPSYCFLFPRFIPYSFLFPISSYTLLYPIPSYSRFPCLPYSLLYPPSPYALLFPILSYTLHLMPSYSRFPVIPYTLLFLHIPSNSRSFFIPTLKNFVVFFSFGSRPQKAKLRFLSNLKRLWKISFKFSVKHWNFWFSTEKRDEKFLKKEKIFEKRKKFSHFYGWNFEEVRNFFFQKQKKFGIKFFAHNWIF